MNTILFEDYKRLDKSKKDIIDITAMYLASRNTYNISEMYNNIIAEMFKNAFIILDNKKKAKIDLSEHEEEIYKILENAVKENNVKGIILTLSIEAIRCVFEVSETISNFILNNTEESDVRNVLHERGEAILPAYSSRLIGGIDVLKYLNFSHLCRLYMNLLRPMKRAGLYRAHEDDDKVEAQDMLECADNGYSGCADWKGYKPILKDDYPDVLRPLYNEEMGYFDNGRGLRVWTAVKGDNIIVSFSGTDIKNIYMFYEDYNQLFNNSILYLEAAGFLNILVEKYVDKNFFICGHSLGGGLAQFSTIANGGLFRKEYKCFAYNPAGLSGISISILGEERIRAAMNKIFVYVTTKDRVSAYGIKTGTLIALPKTDNNGHRIAALKSCMDKYVSTDTAVNIEKSDLIKLDVYTCTSSSVSDFKSIVCSTDKDKVYPIFKNDINKAVSKIKYISLYEDIMNSIIDYEKDDNYEKCMGVYEYFNGDGYTVINRLNLLNENDELFSISDESTALSILLYGEYGAGMSWWMNEIFAVTSKEGSSIKKGDLDRYIGRLSYEYDNMLSSWLFILKNRYQLDLLQYYEENGEKRDDILGIIFEYSVLNENLFFSYNFNRKPTQYELNEYWDKKYNTFKNFIYDITAKMVKDNVLSSDTSNKINNDMLKNIEFYINKIKDM